MMQKPTYRTSKRALWLSSALAWLVILILAIGAARGSDQAVAFANIAVPSMVVLILGILGIHRGGGSLDMYTLHKYNARDQPDAQDPAGSPGGQT
jgi:hypothetical protein